MSRTPGSSRPGPRFGPPHDTLTAEEEEALGDFCAETYADPYAFVLGAYPWGEPGTVLADHDGPDAWQREFLEWLGAEVRARGFDSVAPVKPIRAGVSSGHGIGKGVMASWLVHWIMATRPHCKGTVTANTITQLQTKTWAAVRSWLKLCVIRPLFVANSERMYHRLHPESWFCALQNSKKENSEAFAGQHAANSTSFYVMDEACHDDETEVLTERGWLLFRDLQPGDKALTMDPDTGRACYEQIQRLHATPYVGDLLVYQCRGASFAVTPNHRMFGRRRKQWHRRYGRDVCGPYEFIRADQLCHGWFLPRRVSWQAPDADTFTIPGYIKSARPPRGGGRWRWPERRVPFDAWAALLGWYCSEGHLARQKPNKAGRQEWSGIGITNTDDSRRREIETLARACGFSPLTHRHTVHIHDRPLAEYLAGFGVGALQKRVPDCVRFASARQIGLFLEAMVAGDGYQKSTRAKIIYTSSAALAADLQELCLKAGGQCYVGTRALAGQTAQFGTHVGTSSVDGHVVTWTDVESEICVRPKHLERHSYRGMVYCAELARHHLLLTRRDGYCVWSGNSAIDQKIFEVAEGGLSDGEPMIFLFGNPTRNSGPFHAALFGSGRDKWHPVIVDSRDSKFTNKAQIQEWAEDHGEDSDFFRVRVRGLPPRGSDLQFIDYDRIWDAQRRQAVTVFDDEPLVVGVDVSDGGSAWNVARFRCGLDARSIAPKRMPGEAVRLSRDAWLHVLAGLLRDTHGPRKRPVAHMFVDSAFGAPYVERLRSLGHGNVSEVRFGSECPDRSHANMRAFMWGRMKEWLVNGSIDPKDTRLETDLAAPGWHLDRQDRIVLESKEKMARRGVDSPDDADALALTFAAPVRVGTPVGPSTKILRGPTPPRGAGWLGH